MRKNRLGATTGLALAGLVATTACIPAEPRGEPTPRPQQAAPVDRNAEFGDTDRRRQDEAARRDERERDRQAAIAREGKERDTKAANENAAARASYVAARDQALAGKVEDAKLEDVMNKPSAFKGRTVRLQARWHAGGRGMHADDFGGEPVLHIELSPPLKPKPVSLFALDLADYEAKITQFEGLENARVEVVVSVLGDPLDPAQLPAIGRVLDVKAAK